VILKPNPKQQTLNSKLLSLWHKYFTRSRMRTPTVQTAGSTRALDHLRRLARLMDSQFRVPGTDYRFGLDGLIGLIPGAGDMTTLAVSGYMLYIMAQNGASSYVLARMAVNVIIDAVIGSIPFLGDLFDFAFKANTRNLRLMEQYYQEGRHRGSAWKVLLPILLVLVAVVGLIVYGMWQLIAAIF
jgi:hypothetical protein